VNEGRPSICTQRALTGLRVFPLDPDTDLHRRVERGVEPGRQANDITHLDRRLELDGFDPSGDRDAPAIDAQMSIQLMMTPPKAVATALVCWGNTSSVISVNDSEGGLASMFRG
jgi:hypothetical protein